MIVLPIVARELRTNARAPFTYHLRALGVVALLLASVVFSVNHGLAQTLGGELFGQLHFTLFCAIWIFVPFLTADCISRERREGTLGLLFLTPLRAEDFVAAKGLAQGLRALTLWLAVLPVITISFLLGGLSWMEVALSVMVNFGAICLALAAGLLASSSSRVWTRVLVVAGGVSLSWCFAYALILLVLVAFFLDRGTGILRAILDGDFARLAAEGFWLATDWGGIWPRVLGRTRFGALSGTAAASLCSFLFLLLTIRFVGWRVSRVWREEPLSARILWLEDKFCKPVVFRGFFRRWMLRKLDRNPIGWLEQRSWTGRLATWTWLGLVVCFYSAALSRIIISGGFPQQWMAWLMGGSLALSAAASFRRERETGVLELLLVSPLSASALITGRLRGLWAQFMPAIGLLLGIWVYLATLFGLTALFNDEEEASWLLYFIGAFISLPLIGLYFSLRCRYFITAFLATLVVGLVLPPILAEALAGMAWLYSGSVNPFAWEIIPVGAAVFCQLILAAFCWYGLLSRLKRRAFPLEKAPG
jgi:ABC-type transport system involved in multi-copper enzyme maturation permease subunit